MFRADWRTFDLAVSQLGLQALGVVDLANNDMMTVTPENGPDALLGMSWDPVKKNIVGLAQAAGQPGIYVVR